MSEESKLADFRNRESGSRADWWLLGVTFSGCVINLATTICIFDWNVFGRFALGWLAFGLTVLVWQIFTRRFGWRTIGISIGIAAVGFYVNAHFLAEITASV